MENNNQFLQKTSFKMKSIVTFFLLTTVSSAIYSKTLGPYVNGKFYPKEKNEIIQTVKGLYDKVKGKYSVDEKDKIKALIVPHAGYIFSGRIAAVSYSILKKDYKRFIIIAPSHRAFTDSPITTTANLKTPLGEVKTDTAFVKALLKTTFFKENNSIFENEHAIEVQLPFLQYKYKNFKIVPVLLNTKDISILKNTAKEIYKLLKKDKTETLTIISSDFSHYPSYEDALKVDKTSIESLKFMDPDYYNLTTEIIMSKKIPELYTCACGKAAVITGMELAKLLGANKFISLEYSNSYDENKLYSKKESVVGYVSGAFVYNKKAKKYTIEFSSKEKKELLEIARNEIKNYFKIKKFEIKPHLSENIKFNLPFATFTTLTIKKNLRGCMGTTVSRFTLIDSVRYSSLLAAFNDPRFIPLREEELDKINIEISILSKLNKVESIDKIKKGKHGVMITSPRGSGLFLPQVWEYFNDKEEFLNELCQQKAGLYQKCWENKDSEVYIFTVEDFSE